MATKPKEILDQAKPVVKIYTAYDPPPARARIDAEQESLTNQSFQEECDINNIMAKHRESGIVTHVAAHEGVYADFGEIGDYQESLNRVLACRDLFSELPAELRSQFSNDPGLFMDFVLDPENADGMRELGLLPTERPEPEAGDGGAAEPSPGTGSATPQEPPGEPPAA